MPKVSVIIPVYNTEKYLRKCLDSVCEQTLKDIEIICINDCSTDDSLAILEEYAQRDARVKVIKQQQNKGAGITRNSGIHFATGDYIAFLDSDDFIDALFYEVLYYKAIESDADAVKGCLKLYNPETKTSRVENWIDLNDKIREHHGHFCFTYTSAIFNRNFIIKHSIQFLENQIHFEDPYFTIMATLYYKKVEVVDTVNYYYVDNTQSTSRVVTKKHVESQIYGSQKILELIENADITPEHYAIIYNFMLGQLISWCKRQNVSEEINNLAILSLEHVFERCKYKKECLLFYFLEERKQLNNAHKKNLLDRKAQTTNLLRNRLKSLKQKQ